MANLILQDKKFITPENLKLIVNYGLGFASRVKNLEDKEIAPFEADKMYVKDSLTIYDGYIYKAKVTNQSSIFNEIYWDKIGDDITELTLDEIKAMVGLTTEQLTTLSSIILDSEVRLDKTYSSSKIYTSIQDAIDTSKAYTLSELGKMSGASYKVVTATSDMTDERIIYLLDNGTTFDMYIVENGTPTKIGDTNIDLSDYYTRTEVDNDFLKKTDATSTYATKNELVDKVDKTDIVDNLTSTDTDKPLSANQGMLLKSMIITLTGVVLPYAGSSVPTGFLLCNGQAVSRTDYLDLFGVIGTTYGEGDGSTTFNLPNLQNKFVQGAGTNAVGTEMSAGLPNITGEVGYLKAISNGIFYEGINIKNGCFTNSRNILTDPHATKTATSDILDDSGKTGVIDFNASSSNSIYGNSNTVQPPAVCMNYIIKY